MLGFVNTGRSIRQKDLLALRMFGRQLIRKELASGFEARQGRSHPCGSDQMSILVQIQHVAFARMWKRILVRSPWQRRLPCQTDVPHDLQASQRSAIVKPLVAASFCPEICMCQFEILANVLQLAL